MNGSRRNLRRGLSTAAGALLVIVFLAWMVVRKLEGLESVLGMDSALGWITHGASLLVLTGGAALLAWGIFGRGPSDSEG
ncbi:hypothetical protein [Microbacterium sp. JZ37]|uniref:hypothetical protein n=1 Tax=Microbacterium sp. JZ37 TaxID=2654193 RepID=UPI002B486C6F|nr:hypothetical protein [Microbacterium sp. JZ37]WRH16451.1 hypothetical protein GC092_02230 [Microbacterium sp. JZ37]